MHDWELVDRARWNVGVLVLVQVLDITMVGDPFPKVGIIGLFEGVVSTWSLGVDHRG